jgi:prophage maintenance system killer protein
MKKEQTMIIYQAKTGAIELRGDFTRETLWANRMQMAEMFGVNPQAISKHIQNIYKEKELERKSTSSKMELVQSESGRKVRRQVDIYNLDILISVGYRISSKTGTKFRQWATKRLRSHIVDGYTINKKRLAKNYNAFLKAVEEVKALLPSGGVVDAVNAMELVKMFASTWLSLDAYDKSNLPKTGATKKQVEFTAEEIQEALQKLKHELMTKGEATDLFGSERGGQSVAGIVGNIFQTFGGEDVYPTVEEKAAHLLYFMVKNHPYADGNKRSGAFAFIWFLKQAGILNPARLTSEALTALTLFVAESSPKDKDKMTGLVLLLLN